MANPSSQPSQAARRPPSPRRQAPPGRYEARRCAPLASAAPDHGRDREDGDGDQIRRDRPQQHLEVADVLRAHALSYDWAVVVEAHDADAAVVAVEGASWPIHVADVAMIVIGAAVVFGLLLNVDGASVDLRRRFGRRPSRAPTRGDDGGDRCHDPIRDAEDARCQGRGTPST